MPSRAQLYPGGYDQNPTQNQPGYSYADPYSTRGRSQSESSVQPLYITGVDKAGNKYPEGWTKEDEDAEREFVAEGLFDWKDVRSWRFWIRKKWICEFLNQEQRRERWGNRVC